jgi:hypothetical protein
MAVGDSWARASTAIAAFIVAAGAAGAGVKRTLIGRVPSVHPGGGLLFGRDDYRKVRARAGLNPHEIGVELRTYVLQDLIAASRDNGGF